MNIISVHADRGACTITTDTGRFVRWPGRKINGHQWWSYTPLAGTGAVIVTVPETIELLEAEHHGDVARLQVVA